MQTVTWSNTICSTQGRAIQASCPNETAFHCPGFFTLYDFESEQTNSTLNLIEAIDLVNPFKMTDSYLRAGGGGVYGADAVVIETSRFPSSPSMHITLANNWVKYSRGACVYVRASRLTITGNHIYGCNASGIGAAAVEQRGSYGTITGNTFCGDDWINDITWSMRGGYILAGVGYAVWTGNVFMPNVGGHTNGCSVSVYNPSPGPNVLVANNVGP